MCLGGGGGGGGGDGGLASPLKLDDSLDQCLK